MNQESRKKRVFISAAEPSADDHCAGLISAMRKAGRDDIEFIGVGGPKMQAAGCQLLEITTDQAAMIYNAFWQVWHYIKLIRKIARFLQNNKVDLVVVCDSPAFNFHVAKAAKKARIKTLFYVAPQLWAWAPWRIRKLRKYCDKLACILPFEEQWFRSRGIDTQFVGNPLLDELNISPSANEKNYADFNPNNARVALMPGSRKAEIEKLWLPMQQVAIKIKEKWPGVQFTAVAVDEKKKAVLEEKQVGDFVCEYRIGSVLKTATEVDFTILASGSATLQVAAAACPMVIMYQISRILWYLVGRSLVPMRFFSLVNILADTRLVPEFMPFFNSTTPITDTCIDLLSDSKKLQETSHKLAELVMPLSEGKASVKAVQMVLEMLAADN